ncbi:protein-L-isoaspartate O-methyltransferase [Rufibacter tibetensis]|uniref:Protein-L-isoaspartate O-methyltransferase n=1 Tax=Rufibacter tibetensis TaxID=512763 RepID=A0A0N7HX74_9BACT|nr:protein-L-isoaspartate O-methyltransferase [Rufibacter tibetensis]
MDQDTGFLTQGVYPLQNVRDLDPIINEIGNSQYVLIGEASHGTSEYYTWRADLSKRLIQEKGFTLIAVEGDWPSSYSLNQYVQGRQGGTAQQALQSFRRWPTWMWANQEVASFSEWLRQYNQPLAQNQKVGFYGMDVYSMWESLEEVRNYMQTADPAVAQLAQAALNCLGPYNRDEQQYAQATARGTSCAPQMQALIQAVQAHRAKQPAAHEGAFNAEQNALVAVNAERYYTQMVRSGSESWNVRDRHMQETINRLVAEKGAGAKIIVWAHNTHVGDARYTDMASSGMVNVGQLIREQHAQKGVYLVGFGSYEGQVIASNTWGGSTRVMTVPQAKAGSWEQILHRYSPENKLLLMRELQNIPEAMESRGHRAIGVTYNPGFESGNYVPTILPRRYDAFLYIDKTKALSPL